MEGRKRKRQLEMKCGVVTIGACVIQAEGKAQAQPFEAAGHGLGSKTVLLRTGLLLREEGVQQRGGVVDFSSDGGEVVHCSQTCH